MQALQRVGTHHVPFLQHPEWPNKSVLERHMRSAATQTGHPQPTDGEVREAYNLFWSTHKRPLPPGPPRGNQAHHRPLEQVEYVPGTTVPAVLLLAPNGLKATFRPGRVQGNLWMLSPPTAHPFCPPPLLQDKQTSTPTSCWRCGPQALATPWPLLLYWRAITPYQRPTLPQINTSGYTRTSNGPRRGTRPQWRGAPAPRRVGDSIGEPGTPSTQPSPSQYWPNTAAPRLRPPPTRLNTDAPKVQDWQTVEWTTFHPQKTYLLQYVYGYLTEGHEGNNDYVRMNPAATEIIRQGVGVYATRRLQTAATTPWATTKRVARIHAYQTTTLYHLLYPDDHNTVIFADAWGTTSLTQQPGGQLWS